MTPPYHPSEKYPEWPSMPICNEENPAYRGLRQLFKVLELDIKNYNTSLWNPLREIIKPGDVVVLKPNFVTHCNHGVDAYGLIYTDCLITHGSVLRAVLDYTAKALEGHGKIIIGDCPIQGTDWSKIIELAGLKQLNDYFNLKYPNIELVIKDYRLGRAIQRRDIVIRRIVDEDKIQNYEEIDLKQESLLLPLMEEKFDFGVTQYPKYRMQRAHTREKNAYFFPKEFVYADVVINLPKMKSHKKAGITCALKNFIGLNGHKDYLPHFRFGSPKNGGDEYPDGNWLWDLMWFFFHKEWELEKGILKRILFFLAKVCSSFLPFFSGLPKNAASIGGGSWHGNDTLWRTILDINRAFFYYDRGKNHISSEICRDVKYFAILDGLIGGHRESPLSPSPVKSGILMAAFNPLALDAVATAMMGFDVNKKNKTNRRRFLVKNPTTCELSHGGH